MGAKVAGMVRPDEAIAKFDLKAEPHVVSEGRALVAETLIDWSLGHLVDDVKLIASELITDAVDATLGRPIWLVLRRGRDALSIGIWDSSSDTPRMLPAAPGEESGRGLRIIAALADDHGSLSVGNPKGKLVWARVQI